MECKQIFEQRHGLHNQYIDNICKYDILTTLKYGHAYGFRETLIQSENGSRFGLVINKKKRGFLRTCGFAITVMAKLW